MFDQLRQVDELYGSSHCIAQAEFCNRMTGRLVVVARVYEDGAYDFVANPIGLGATTSEATLYFLACARSLDFVKHLKD